MPEEEKRLWDRYGDGALKININPFCHHIPSCLHNRQRQSFAALMDAGFVLMFPIK